MAHEQTKLADRPDYERANAFLIKARQTALTGWTMIVERLGRAEDGRRRAIQTDGCRLGLSSAGIVPEIRHNPTQTQNPTATRQATTATRRLNNVITSH
jgi:hypothetical protein